MTASTHPAARAPNAAALGRLRWFAWALLGYSILVMLWGAYVRATGSGAGCGSHWPLCNGEVIPRIGVEKTLVELTHRVTSSLAWLGSAVLYLLARRATPPRSPMRAASFAVLVLMSTEALVGAGIVLFEMVADNASLARAGWMSAHLVNTFALLFALALAAHRSTVQGRLRFTGQGTLLPVLAFTQLALLFVSVSGAVTALGDTLFPASSLAHGIAQELSPAAHIFVRLRVLHPLLALIATAFVLSGVAFAAIHRRVAMVRRAALLAAFAFILQLAVGFANIALLAPVWLQVIHLAVADVLWVAVSFVSIAALDASLAGAVEPRAEPSTVLARP